MSFRGAFAHPAALTLLGIGLVFAAGLVILPSMRLWVERVPLVLFWTLLAYVASAIAIHRTRPTQAPSPEMRTLRAIRHAIAERLVEHKGSGSGSSELADVLSDALVHIDEQLAPALSQVVDRQRGLSKHLARYDRGELPPPDAEVLDRLHAIAARQQRAIDECVRQAANADATLVALLQEADESSLVGRAQTWSYDLLTLYDTLADVLHAPDGFLDLPMDAEPYQAAPAPSVTRLDPSPISPTRLPAFPDAPSFPPGIQSTGQSNGQLNGRSDGFTVEPGPLLPFPPGPLHENGTHEAEMHHDDVTDDQFARFVEDALRRLNNPAALASSNLLKRLPLSIDAMLVRWQGARLVQATPLERSQALHEVLAQAIGRLKPASAAGNQTAAGVLHSAILYEEYLEGRQNKEITLRYNISEATFHRYRRDAISVLARELREQEHLLGRVNNGTAHTPAPATRN